MLPDDDDEQGLEFEQEEEGFPYPDTLSGPSGEVFFYPDLGAFCEQHGAKAVQISEDGGIWLYPQAGGKPVSLGDWKPSGQVKALRTVQ